MLDLKEVIKKRCICLNVASSSLKIRVDVRKHMEEHHKKKYRVKNSLRCILKFKNKSERSITRRNIV